MKGQWFIVSAALAAIVFFSISLILKNYTAVSTEPLNIKEDFYFKMLKYSTAQALNFEEFKLFAEQEMAKRGYYVEITQDSILVSTNKMKIQG
jgi:hypothetical protein